MNQLAASFSPLVQKRLLLKRTKLCRRAYTDTSIKSYVLHRKDGENQPSSQRQKQEQNTKHPEDGAAARQEYIERCAFEISAC